MQNVSVAWSVEEQDTVRRIAHSLLVSWHKQTTIGNKTWTIGVSTIGGPDVIGINPGAVGGPGIYKYFDESVYVKSLEWERSLNMPVGGMTKALAEAVLDNTSGRFLPRYMGGASELYTAILPRRPAIINAGFNYDGVDNLIPQFSGVFDKYPQVNKRTGQVSLSMADYIDFFKEKKLDQTAMFTGITTDVLIENLFTQLGMSTAQYDLDPGINVIPFALLEKGASFSDKINKLVQSENGHLYQDEEGIFRFENRQHWDSPPFTQVQRVIPTSQVINAEAPNEDHIINMIEVKGSNRAKQPVQPLINSTDPTVIQPASQVELFFSYEDPVLQVITPTPGGTDSFFESLGGIISIKSIDNFAQATKIVFQNTSSTEAGTITRVFISGRPAKQVGEIYYRGKRDASITAYEERPLTIENEYVADPTWAASLAEMLLEDFSQIENLQRITIRSIPELQLGDLISWGGRYFRIYDIKTKLDPSVGFIQELAILQKRVINSYFRVGVSLVGGSDKISP